MWPSHLGVLVKQILILRDGYQVHQLGCHRNSSHWNDHKAAMMGNKIHHWILCHWANDAKMGPMALSGMPTMQTQNRNHSAYTTMPKHSSSSNRSKKPPGTQSIAQRLGDQTKYNGRPKQGLPGMEFEPTSPPDAHRCQQLQSFVSWENFSHGFLAASWHMQQQQYYENKQLQRSSAKWISEVLKWVLKSTRQQWDHRNKELHQQQPNQIKDLEVNANIQEQYNLGSNGLLRASKALFRETSKHTLNLPHNDKRQWLASIKATRNQYQWASARSITAQRTLLRNWLQPQQLQAP